VVKGALGDRCLQYCAPGSAQTCQPDERGRDGTGEGEGGHEAALNAVQIGW